MSAEAGAGPEEDQDPFEAFVDEKREWLEEQAAGDAKAAWVAQRLLDEYGGEADGR